MSQSHATEFGAADWTVVDLADRFGAMPLSRIRRVPVPGTATEQDVIEIDAHEDRLCELVDGILVEKTVGAFESYLAVFLARLLGNYVETDRLGIVLGEGGMMRLAPGLVRIPDVSFISRDRLPGHRVPREPIPDLAPDLAVEVISRSNTREEMQRKLHDYFAAGVRLVWYVYHTPRREVWAYVSPEEYSVVCEDETLTGGDVLPGFRLALADLFAEPSAPR